MTDARPNQASQIGLELYASSSIGLSFDSRREGITEFIAGFVINVTAIITILNATKR